MSNQDSQSPQEIERIVTKINIPEITNFNSEKINSLFSNLSSLNFFQLRNLYQVIFLRSTKAICGLFLISTFIGYYDINYDNFYFSRQKINFKNCISCCKEKICSLREYNKDFINLLLERQS